MKHLFLTVCLLLSSIVASAQLNFTWELVPMDSSWDEIKDPAATNIILKYAEMIDPLQEIIGYSTAEFSKQKPESGLSNFAADAIRAIAEKESGGPIDIALTNFGGIRTNLPNGAVRVYDIFSIFPFDNNLVVFDIKGSDLQKFLNDLARKNRLEVFSNVEFVIKNGKFEKCYVAGAPVQNDKIYKFATINFLMDGGDSIFLSEYAQNIVNYDIFIRDAIVDYVKGITANGEKLDLKSDGRVIIK